MQYLNGITEVNVIISDKNCITFLFRISKSTLNTGEFTTQAAATAFAVRQKSMGLMFVERIIQEGSTVKARPVYVPTHVTS